MTRKYKIFFASLFLYILVLVLITLPGVEFHALDVIASLLTRINVLASVPCHIPHPPGCGDLTLQPTITILPHVFMLLALLGFSYLINLLILFFSDKDSFWQASNIVILFVLIVYIVSVFTSNLGLIGFGDTLVYTGNTEILNKFIYILGLFSLIGLGDVLISLYTKIESFAVGPRQ